VTTISPELLALCDRMPAFPASVQQVISLASDINSPPKKLVRVIDHDPVLTMKILKVANSAYFGLSRKIISINHAVVYLGLNTVKHVALAIAAIGSLPRENDSHFDMDDFLLHSLSTAVLTRSLAQKIRVPETEAANFFVAGLLHDIGQVVFAQFKPKQYSQVLQQCRTSDCPLNDAEKDVFGFDHGEVGAVLGTQWDFPEKLVNAIRMHHIPGTGPRNSNIRKCLFVANLLAGRVNHPTNAPPAMTEEDMPPWVFSTFGDDFSSIIEEMENLETDLQQATSLLQVSRT
jgi:putative nucleotidyltransferase with HDIG domain